ncbi:uncharacterized protein C8Q71DRAFT_713682 [Rhodofomes roseus]|uniref:RING-type domain-containing protein n=1 Tax=Rhodofomes roseus TaxID=34475 RepID=A0ABQ8K6M2_9APHY|nr:uncharacterized protein C8Q71DRAFT_713682 [Rhodofomes roseus]KAH9832854.1 hypothetical protein C8Q71DRAFT_713682 [Rhodofomes roseus]
MEAAAARRHAYAATSAAGAQASSHDDPAVGFEMEPIPGPMGFVTSGYFFGLFIMALVLNRIQNIVVPPRNPHATRLRAARNASGRLSFLYTLLGLFFPVDLSSTFPRTVFRIPSIYNLSKALLLWTVLLLQAARFWPSWRLLQPVGQWVAQKEMEEICWFTFTSTCLALAIGALTGGMEGLHLNHNAPFNLFSFAFQLHIYSSPSTHVDNFQGLPSRPGKHVILIIMIPLLQLTLLHCMEVRKSWARLRLIPTTFCSLLSLVHFHSVIWTSPKSYPLTNFFPSVVESMLICLISFSALLNVATQLLLEGAVTRPLFGHVESLMPKMDEDFGVALVRLGTASLEATSAAGMGNEVGGMTSAGIADVVARPPEEDRGVVEIDRSGVVSLTPAFDWKGHSRVRKRGFLNEITNVKAQVRRSGLWADTMVNAGWYKAVLMFFVSVVKAFKRVVVGSCVALWGKVRAGASMRRQPPPISRLSESVEDEGDAEDMDTYRRFLRGESVSDDEDDFVPATDEFSSRNTFEPSESGDESPAEGDESARLFADLSQDAASSAAAPVLLAHLASTSTSPLTRRMYRSTALEQSSGDDAVDNWGEFARERRETKIPEQPVDDDSLEVRRNCVICTVELRDIICWPCRCLALCNDCRENLASRSSASKHTCPCCRRRVEGYSRIYIP